ncbi:hypothetical protein AXF42_Ash002497 [Apostasia shenzhenica]|uniref:Btz domain-containing protein n=1 Tax=Apostasia shenzhenica TaxID=1088818 RepID=A0A2I0ANT4_9ASPA|nr:hypothetical protein AXF42_Ash002497 [Apostasia shenzhenica]
MADGEEVEYESDPEDALLPSVMRRREASDDEDGEGSGSERERKQVRKERAGIGSDDELEGQGGAPGYDDEEYEEQEEEEIPEEEVEEEDQEVEEGAIQDVGLGRNDGEFEGSAPMESSGEMVGYRRSNQTEEEEKKENEPYAVPTAGAFYMHDDRFQENGRGRHRRMPGGRRLWESKDERAWVHDRFEEMNLQDSRYEERRSSKGRFRGRGSGRGRGAVRGFGKGARPRGYYDDNDSQNRSSKFVRGRGPRRYESSFKHSDISPNQHKQSPKPQQLASVNGSGRQISQVMNVQSEPVAPRKQVFASSLNSASPPFYPSGSSSQDTSKRDMQTGNKSQSSSKQMENNFLSSQSSSIFRGKAVADSAGLDRLYLDESVNHVPGKSQLDPQLRPSGSSLSLSNANLSPQHKVQVRNSSTISSPMLSNSLNYATRIPLQNQSSVVQPKSVQTQGQHALRISTTQLVGQHLVTGNQVVSQSQAPGDIFEVGEVESPPGSSKSRSALVGKGKTASQSLGRGSLLYGGAQVIRPTGATGLPHGDQNFPGTPALLPVMQFGGQHPGGLGVQAVGMALPGYVAQPQLGFGNSEMTWVPVLAGAAGALGASYCPPYLALDGSYYARPSGQTSASSSTIKESSGAKPANTLSSAQKPELVNDDLTQRHNKPRRYSEMNFGQ